VREIKRVPEEKMATPSLEIGAQVVLERATLQRLLDLLRQRGYRVVGPTVRENAVVYDDLTRIEELPIGWTDDQAAGVYRLKKHSKPTLFNYVVGPQSLKKFLHPPEVCLWKARRHDHGFEQQAAHVDAPKLAFFGVRPCELHALAAQDRVLMGGEYADPLYKARREKAFIVAVNCAQTGGTCFCVSMKTGPKAARGFDLALTEILDGQRHYFVVEVGTKPGAAVLSAIPHQPARQSERQTVARALAQAAERMGRRLDTTGIKELLYRNYEHPRWDDVAARCLTCGNCTMVCPTCFCTTVEDGTDLGGEHAERRCKWDSCFTADFSYIHGGSIRASARSRYRQWLAHKLATWHDQFGSSGCVGCGRCITWCPAAIDITEEVRAIRESKLAHAPS
jgi:ferredoxin